MLLFVKALNQRISFGWLLEEGMIMIRLVKYDNNCNYDMHLYIVTM